MEFYAEVRRSVYVEGLSERAAARRFGLARETVRKMLRYRLPPGYRRAKPIRCPKLDAFTRVIDQILTDDQQPTVGYGDMFPITTGGRVFTFFVLFLGLGIVAVPTGLFASALAKAREEEGDDRGPH